MPDDELIAKLRHLLIYFHTGTDSFGTIVAAADRIAQLTADKADAWDEGAIWGFDERGPIDGTHLQLVPDDNPYRATTPRNNQESNT